MMNKPDVSISALQDRTARVLEKKTPIQEKGRIALCRKEGKAAAVGV